MPYRRHTDRRKAYLVVGAVVGLVLIGVALVVVTTREDDGGAAGDTEIAGERTDRRATGEERRRDRARDRKERDDRPRPAPAPDWLAGAADTGSYGDGAHRAVLTATTARGTLIGVKYAFRTGAGFRDGQTTSSSGSWSAAETVRGHEPLAGLIAQVVSGTVTCTASIDGRVVYTKTSSGRFATVVCAA